MNEDKHRIGDAPPPPLCFLLKIKYSRECVEEADSSNNSSFLKSGKLQGHKKSFFFFKYPKYD